MSWRLTKLFSWQRNEIYLPGANQRRAQNAPIVDARMPDEDLPPFPAHTIEFTTVGLDEWRARLCNGNIKEKDERGAIFLERQHAVALFDAATQALETNQEMLIGVLQNPETANNPIRRAHKLELVLSKVMLEAFKPFGFKSGVDAKRALTLVGSEQCDLNQSSEVEEAKTRYMAEYKKISEQRGSAGGYCGEGRWGFKPKNGLPLEVPDCRQFSQQQPAPQ